MEKPSGNSDPSRRRRRSRRRKKNPNKQGGATEAQKQGQAQAGSSGRASGQNKARDSQKPSGGDRGSGQRRGKSQKKRRPDPAARSEKGRGEKAPSSRPPKRIGNVQLNSSASLERLRNRIEDAAKELHRLREENAALVKRLSDLEANPMMDFEGTLIALDEDPDALRTKIEGYIAAIDSYLNEEDTNNTGD